MIRVADIKELVVREFGITHTDLISERQAREVSTPRLIGYKLTKQFTSYSYPRIGREFGGRDHTTIITGIRSIEKQMLKDPELKDHFDRLHRGLTQLAAANSTEGENGEPPLSDRQLHHTGEGRSADVPGALAARA